ncbi:MAG: hypothetical protein J6C65_04625 [Prevotella sp.]|nr:hypothetical protein [Prevotella sp.]
MMQVIRHPAEQIPSLCLLAGITILRKIFHNPADDGIGLMGDIQLIISLSLKHGISHAGVLTAIDNSGRVMAQNGHGRVGTLLHQTVSKAEVTAYFFLFSRRTGEPPSFILAGSQRQEQQHCQYGIAQ